MRKILYLLQETRCEQLKTMGQESRIPEVREMYGFMENAFNSVSLGGANGQVWDAPYTKLSEALTTGDFSYALGEFVQRSMVPGYATKRFDFEPLVKPDTLPNYLSVTNYQGQHDIDIGIAFRSDKAGG